MVLSPGGLAAHIDMRDERCVLKEPGYIRAGLMQACLGLLVCTSYDTRVWRSITRTTILQTSKDLRVMGPYDTRTERLISVRLTGPIRHGYG